ncbi:uncharacterized protein LOC128678291 [Plodia interpunctella]|uniref:uncharacterized protein LOC128678291 n=1 Tax=Plodia interpunctella TaxID=58824 RepID=UPI002368D383|nr:uncharacterized protein LOC128678291 [Plodia interpunctella]
MAKERGKEKEKTKSKQQNEDETKKDIKPTVSYDEVVRGIMAKVKGQKKEKTKSNLLEDNSKKDVKPSVSDSEVSQRTRRSNVKDDGFYSFKNMMMRNVKSQPEVQKGRVSKKPKKRVKKRS